MSAPQDIGVVDAIIEADGTTRHLPGLARPGDIAVDGIVPSWADGIGFEVSVVVNPSLDYMEHPRGGLIPLSIRVLVRGDVSDAEVVTALAHAAPVGIAFNGSTHVLFIGDRWERDVRFDRDGSGMPADAPTVATLPSDVLILIDGEPIRGAAPASHIVVELP